MKRVQLLSLFKVTILFFLPVLFTNCSQEQEEPLDIAQLEIKKFVPFEQFILNTQKAEYKNYTELPGSKVLNEEEFLRMKDYILKKYKGVNVKNSFVMDSVMFVDCIDINTQPGLRQDDGKYLSIAESPPVIDVNDYSDTTDAIHVKPMLDREKKDAFGNVMFCEEGFIPMRRTTLGEVTRYKTLDDFLSKAGKTGYKGLQDVK